MASTTRPDGDPETRARRQSVLLRQDELLELVPRQRPTQQRSRQVFDAVLRAFRELLVEVGFDSSTCEEAAVRAEVPISTLYQFFDNKYVIVCELNRQDLIAATQELADFPGEVPSMDWLRHMNKWIDHLGELWMSDPSRREVWLAMQSTPDTRATGALHQRELAEALQQMLRPLMPRTPRARRTVVAQVLVHVVRSMLSFSVQEGHTRSQAVAELKRLMVAYLLLAEKESRTRPRGETRPGSDNSDKPLFENGVDAVSGEDCDGGPRPRTAHLANIREQNLGHSINVSGGFFQGKEQILLPRRRPAQARSKRKFDALLHASRELLVEIGFESFTCEEAAVRAEVPISTLYQFFDNKYVIVCELNRQDLIAATQELADFPGEVPSMDWLRHMNKWIDHLGELWMSDPSRREVWLAMQSTPDTRATGALHQRELAEALQQWVRPLMPLTPRAHRAMMSQVFVHILYAMLSFSVQEGHTHSQAVAELKRLMVASLLLAEQESRSRPGDGEPSPLNPAVDARRDQYLAAIAQGRGELREAEHLYTRALMVFEELGDRPAIAHSCLALAAIAHSRGDDREAMELYTRGLVIQEELGDRAAVAATYRELAVLAHERGDSREAEDRYIHARVVFEELGDRAGMAGTYHQLGVLAQDRGDCLEAEQQYLRALAIENELGDRAAVAATYRELAVLAHERGDSREAEDRYMHARVVFEELGDRAGMAGTYHQLGVLAQDRGDYEGAEHLYIQALALVEELGDLAGIARGNGQLGIVAQLRGEMDRAEHQYTRALSIKEELGDRAGMASSYHQLGILAHLRGDYSSAESWYTRALSIVEEFGDRSGVARSCGQLAVLAHDRGDYSKAEGLYARALGIFEAQGDRAEMARSYRNLAILAQDQGNDSKAKHLMTRALAVAREFDEPHTSREDSRSTMKYRQESEREGGVGR
ncbi:tetratricopeptide repeat protein [Nocardia nova]|nr:tetratricopeptide repeat protein [Nocardia nova]